MKAGPRSNRPLLKAALAVCAMLMLCSSVEAISHRGYFGSSYSGASECASCHRVSGGIVEEVEASSHFTLHAPASRKELLGGGEHGMVDVFSGIYGSYFMGAHALEKEKVGSGQTVGEGCGSCHVGRFEPLSHNDRKQDVDCLVCHARDYDLTTREAVSSTPDGPSWEWDESLSAAESVNGLVESEACLRCHGYTFSGHKRGAPFVMSNNVHAEEGLSCVYCHSHRNHQFTSGQTNLDLFVRERPYVTTSCENCHGQGEHADPEIVSHLDRIACQTCHIPETRGLTKVLWGPIADSLIPDEREAPKLNSDSGFYEPYREYTPGYDRDDLQTTTGAVRPTYRWHNPDDAGLGWPRGSRSDPESKLYPFKRIKQGLLFDTSLTMADFYDAFQDALKNAGLLRAGGLTSAERTTLSGMPMPLPVDPAHYASAGGEPGGLKRSIGLGLGRLKNSLLNLGLTSEDEIAQQGSALWSGNYSASYEREDANLPISGEYFSLSHGVRRAGEALTCEDCHQPESPIGFAEIGYTASEAAYLESFLVQTPAVMVTSDRASYTSSDEIRLKFASYNAGEAVTADVYLAFQLPGGIMFFYPTFGVQASPAATLFLDRGLKLPEFEIPGSPFLAGALGGGVYNIYAAAVTPGTRFDVLGHLSVCQFEID